MMTSDAISEWLVSYLAKLLDVDPGDIDPAAPLGDYGLDSAGAAGLSADLGQWLGIEVPDAVAFDFPSVRELSAHVLSMLERRHDR